MKGSQKKDEEKGGWTVLRRASENLVSEMSGRQKEMEACCERSLNPSWAVLLRIYICI